MNPLSLRILAGLGLGLAAGALLAGSTAGATLQQVAGPVGRLWLEALTMTVVPLVTALLISGMSGASGAGQGRLAPRALAAFAVALLAACLASAALTSLALAAWPVPAAAASLRPDGTPPVIGGDWLAGLFANPVRAAADTAMLPLVIFALLFGIALGRLQGRQRRVLDAAFGGIVTVMLTIVHWVLWLGPIGVFALASGVGARAGLAAFGVLGHYVALVIAACLVTLLLAWAAAWLLGRLSPLAFLRAALPAQAIALSTQSSLAALPAMLDSAAALGVRRADAGVVLPLAVSVFRAASAAANVTVAVWLAALHGVPLSPTTLVTGAVVAAAVSVAAVGLPAQVSFFAIIGPVCIAMGVPVALLPLLLGIETVPDIFRTLGNVTADLAVTRVIGQPAVEASQPVPIP